MAVSRGYHFYQNPGPTNIPDRVLRAMDRGAIDFTGAQFKAIAEECFAGLKRIFKTDETILAYAASGHGALEAALVNLFSPGDKVLVVESGFSRLTEDRDFSSPLVDLLAVSGLLSSDPARGSSPPLVGPRSRFLVSSR